MIANSSVLVLLLRTVAYALIRKQKVLFILTLLAFAPCAQAAWSLVITNGYGDTYRMNMLRNRDNYQAYRGICSYRGFSLSGCSTTGEVVMLRIKATPVMPEYYSLVSTSLRWGTTMYFLNDMFHPLNSRVMTGYENWYPFDMSCSVAMYINSGGFGAQEKSAYAAPDLLGGSAFSILTSEDRGALFSSFPSPSTAASYSLVMTNGYGDTYRMNMLRDRDNYQAYRGICSYRGFSLSGCSTTGEVVMLRIKATPVMPEHYSLLSTSLRWGTTMYVLNDVFHPLNSWVMTGYENWYPFDMSCSVAMYISSGGLGANSFRPEPLTAQNSADPFVTDNGTGTNLIGVLLPLTGDLADTGLAYQAALNLALSAITNTPGMPPIRLWIEDTHTDAETAYYELAEMRSNGCHIVLGPESSEECRILKTYANENDVLLISSSATVTSLAIPGDNLMRLTIDDSNQARALADLLEHDGISDIAILSRSDIYGEGFMSALIHEHNARGGTVFATNYCPRATGFLPEVVSNLATQVSARCAVRGANRVGVVTILFDEGVDVLQQAASHPALHSVRWYGTDGMAQNRSLATNALASTMAAHVGYTCSAFGRFTNALYGAVESAICAQLSVPAMPRYPMSSYDALWLVAKALQQTGGTNTMSQLVAAIHSVATNYEGCTSPITFNDADDRATGTYDMWLYTTSGWVLKTNEVNPISRSFNDYDGDGKSDPAAYQDGQMTVAFSGSGYEIFGAVMGGPGGIECSADFDGDGKTDPAVYNPATSLLWVLFSSRSYALGGMSMGGDGCVPVVGDFDGDGKADPAVYVAMPGLLVAWLSNSGYSNAYTFSAFLGGTGWLNASADYDGDGKTDPAVFQPASGKWQMLLSSHGYSVYGWTTAGGTGVVPVPGDYDGDGKADLIVYQVTSGLWLCALSSQGYATSGLAGIGGAAMIPRPGDYDNDGKTDPAVYDPLTRTFYVMLSGSNYQMASLSW